MTDLDQASDTKTDPKRLSMLMRKYRAPARHFLLHSPGTEEEEFSEEEREDAMKIVSALAANPSLPSGDYLSAAYLAPEALAQNPKIPALIGKDDRKGLDDEMPSWVDKIAEDLAHRVLQREVLFVCQQAGQKPSMLARELRKPREMVPMWVCSWRSPELAQHMLHGAWPTVLTSQEQQAGLRVFRKKLQDTFNRSDAHEFIDFVFANLRGWPFVQAVSRLLLELEARYGVDVPSTWPDLIAGEMATGYRGEA